MDPMERKLVPLVSSPNGHPDELVKWLSSWQTPVLARFDAAHSLPYTLVDT